ncbi:MAG: AraC family transcriptional regulator [Myxococcales bacterium]|nr:AraC family transcriptional regulator [Myxococcales bacterium]
MTQTGPMATVSTELLLPSIHALEQLEPEVALEAYDGGLQILAEAGYVRPPRSGDDPMRVSYQSIIDVLENSRRVSGDPAFGLSGGRGLRRGDLGVFQFVTGTAATLGESMLLAVRYLPLLHDGARITLRESGDLVALEYRDLPGLPRSVAANEYVLSALLVGSQQALGFAAPPNEVRFAHARPAHVEAYVPLFGSELRFDCDHNAIVLPRAAMDLPLATSDPPLQIVMRRHADDLLRRLPHADPFVQRVRTWARANLQHGARLGALADAFHLSESTVQRKLQAACTSHSEIVDEVRRERAPELLADPALNVSEVAFQLGFAHRPAFHRAFVRWFGRSPREYRENRPRTQFDEFFERMREES